MKKYSFLFILMLLPMLASAEDVKINETTFPDTDFRNWVLSQDYGKDGVLTEGEIAEVTFMNLFPQNIIAEGHIQSLKGIEYFTAMTKLVCSRNELTELDLSKNTALTWLECYGNHLKELDLSNNPELTYLECLSNELTTLDILNCTKLTELYCFDNQLTTLNVSGCSALTMLKCYSNPLTELNVYGCTSLTTMWVSNNKLSVLDVSDCTSLTALWCDNNQLTLLDVSKNKNLSDLRCGENQLTQLDMSKNTMLTELRCNDNQLTALDLSKNKQLTSLRTYHNPINGKSMDALIESLPTVSRGSWCVVLSEDEEGVVTATQVAAAKAKGWISKYWNESAKNWMDYAGSETTTKYFPTGMTWEEIVVNPNMEQEDDNACIYEIGTDTIIGNVTYKKVLKDNILSGLCVRESGDKVWLLTKEYPTEILLYNFDWDSNQEIVTEYLKGHEVIGFIGQNMEAYEVRQETTPVGDSQTVVIDGKTYQYYRDSFIRSQIRGIGKVAELNRYPCLLSYREPAVILPGLDYHKVHWIKRNGVEIFRSESAKEWTVEIMDGYRPMIEDGKVWKVGNSQTILDNSVQVVDYYYFDGDTIIDGKTCKQMMCQRFVNPDYSNEYWTPTPSLSKVGAWYEENQKVYFYDEREQSMKMKYDFSLAANDTLKYLTDWPSPFIIGPKQTGGIEGFKGVYRDIRMCDEGQSYHDTFWLEGVGCLRGPISNPCDPILGDPLPDFVMSCVVGDEVIYFNDRYEDAATPARVRKGRFDFTHNKKIKPRTRMSSEEEPSLYGEYNDQQLDINLEPLDDTYQVCITNGSGKAVYEKTINAGNIVGLNIDISAYTKGHYTVTVENSLESFTGEFETLTNGISDAVRLNDKGKMINDKLIYNLQGQRLNSLQKGLNIVNGRKIYVRN